MKRAIAKRWVAALRSGKYKQGRGQLRDGNKFCCLGVLCDISKLSEWNLRENGEYGYLQCGSILPGAVSEWSGLKTPSGDFCSDNFGRDCLAALNDDHRRFSTIAKVIEEHWKEL